MRVLYLTHHLPWPPHSGGRLREAELLARLSASFDIEVIAVSKASGQDSLAIPSAIRAGVDAHVFGALSRWNPLSGPLARRHNSTEAREYLLRTMERHSFRVIHVEGHFLMSLLPAEARRRSVLVEHNVESSLFLQRVRLSRKIRERVGLRRQLALTRRDEMKAWREASAVVAVTGSDAQAIQDRVPDASVHVVPNGFDHLDARGRAAPRAGGSPDHVDLVMVGNYAYQPSEDAALRLMTDVYPRVLEQRPDTTLALVGNNPSTLMRQVAEADPRITITGRVADVGEWLESGRVFVCPLRVGGGIKVKVVEALAKGRVVVTTPVGSQGLEGIPPDALIVRDDDAAIASACVRLLQNPTRSHEQGAKARHSVASMPTWDDAAEMLASCWLAGVPARSGVGVEN
jgi:glycosyltransferase involved in cell wall biosynthesis